MEKFITPEAILATNTSSLSVEQIGAKLKNPERVVGFHFFNPVAVMPLIEVVRTPHTTDETLATAMATAAKLRKNAVITKDTPGFVVNRILGPYMNEAAFLLAEGAGAERIDRVMEKFGMPMGPITLLDEVGLDVAAKVSKVLFGAFGERMKPPGLFDKVFEEKRFGKKSGKGIYLWEDGKKSHLDKEFLSRVGIQDGSGKATDEEIEKRLVYLMVNEAARCLEEGLVRDVSDIDIGMIFGTGFAPFRGGLCRYADTVGAEHIVADLEIYARNLGTRFQPAPYLQQLAVGNKKFYS